jgi:membrane protease YdiL (CAAX protease family)
VTRTRTAIVLTIAVLWGTECLRTFVLPASTHLAVNLLAAGGVYAIARWARATDAELGLVRWGPGLRLGLLALALVAVTVAVGALLPATREVFERASRPDGTGALLVEVLVSIPLGTVVLEELAFRGSLLALLRRETSARAAVAGSSVLFALWHVIPSVWSRAGSTDAALESAGVSSLPLVLVATFVAGLVFCWLRLRSGSLLAPFLAHAGANSAGTLAVWFVRG